ncbi:peptidoglycan-binding domain-containing protein [Allocoleopsis franciscana]|uniref:Putative peptidoglycan-binding domain-containing protein n=1 Tax=Allocoleopsis franciscana PCC 7113 TaxID=1173027 RepID=K9W8C7_9CYAN|nr:peptidoglycan-binding domain-containing protein [Allocoleopsis franciscana]AFZ16488.1 putative peptidoglycan-binding domain-containing protein [Allocoleopsis franciscana PCC 7113]
MQIFNLSQVSTRKAALKLPVVRQGSSGSAVRVLQQLLNFKGFKLEVNGQFDLPTQIAVKNFQQMNALTVNGIVDAETWYHLSIGLLSVRPIESEFAPQETQSLNLC